MKINYMELLKQYEHPIAELDPEKKQKLQEANDNLNVADLLRDMNDMDVAPNKKYRTNYFGDFITEIHLARCDRWYNTSDHDTRSLIGILNAYEMYEKFIEQETGLVLFGNNKILRKESYFSPALTPQEFQLMGMWEKIRDERVISICELSNILKTNVYEIMELVNKSICWTITTEDVLRLL